MNLNRFKDDQGLDLNDIFGYLTDPTYWFDQNIGEALCWKFIFFRSKEFIEF